MHKKKHNKQNTQEVYFLCQVNSQSRLLFVTYLLCFLQTSEEIGLYDSYWILKFSRGQSGSSHDNTFSKKINTKCAINLSSLAEM